MHRIHKIKILGIFALASFPINTRAEIITLPESIVIGPKIGFGNVKEVFGLENTSQWVALSPIEYRSISASRVLELEIENLSILKSYSVPTPIVHHKLIEIGGRLFIFMERFAAGSKTDEQFYSLTTAHSDHDLLRIQSSIDEHRLKIGDLQFLINTQGRVVVNDPLSVEPNAKTEQVSKISIALQKNAKDVVTRLKENRIRIERRCLGNKTQNQLHNRMQLPRHR